MFYPIIHGLNGEYDYLAESDNWTWVQLWLEPDPFADNFDTLGLLLRASDRYSNGRFDPAVSDGLEIRPARVHLGLGAIYMYRSIGSAFAEFLLAEKWLMRGINKPFLRPDIERMFLRGSSQPGTTWQWWQRSSDTTRRT
ncbi:hypothetical protein G7085_16880 [Tessaracoccus sp. HDW20]|uniref:hypothetical protein n=1 Tax=Tessaracoccus coleopterorum TaxID=2714950 RepID=UPI0018D29665|nr:hypothetical protein [Tessaracoccus coleopterorum]NHB85702.1 hypothetical protein [Tessaracoccus coleopterorum]